MKRLKELYEGLNARIFSIITKEKGQTMIEYALVAVLIAIVLVFMFKHSGVDSGISGAGSKVASALK